MANGLQCGVQALSKVWTAGLPGLLQSRGNTWEGFDLAAIAVGIGNLKVVTDDTQNVLEDLAVSGAAMEPDGLELSAPPIPPYGKGDR